MDQAGFLEVILAYEMGDYSFWLKSGAMRVVMLTQNIVGVGGTYARCYSLARNLATLGYHVTLVAASRQRRLTPHITEVSGVRIVEMGSLLPKRFRHGGLSLLDLLNRFTYLSDYPLDIIHTFDHRPTVSFPAFMVRRQRRVPVVGDWCDLWGKQGLGSHRRGIERVLLTQFDDVLERWAMSRMDAVTVISTALRHRALKLGIPQHRIQLVPAGASDDLIQTIPTAEARRRFSLPVDVPIIAYSGYTAFGAELLGEAFTHVVRRYPSAKLLLVGGRLPQVERIAENAGISQQVIHMGPVSYERLKDVLACADVMLLPYPNVAINQVNFPNKLGDYMAAGRPVVTNPTGDMGQMVQDEGIGMVTSEDPQAYAEAICVLLADPVQREAMGKRARHLAETRYSWRAMAQKVDALYQTLL